MADLVNVDDNGLYSIVFAEALINALWGIVQTKSALADEKIQGAIDLADGDYNINSSDLSSAISGAIATFKGDVARPNLPPARRPSAHRPHGTATPMRRSPAR